MKSKINMNLFEIYMNSIGSMAKWINFQAALQEAQVQIKEWVILSDLLVLQVNSAILPSVGKLISAG